MIDLAHFDINPLGDAQVDDILHGLVGIYEAVFPDRIRAYYLTGSHVDRTTIALSDLDLLVLFKEPFAPPDQATAQRLNLVLYLSRLCPLRLDVPARSETVLSPGEGVTLLRAARLVYGEDIRDRVALPDHHEYVQWADDAARAFCARLHDVTSLVDPLDYPDPAGEFFGYDRVRIPAWYPPSTTQGIKELVTAVGRMATALVALQTDCYIATKAEAFRLYRECLHDEWTLYLDTLYAKGKGEWEYCVPEDTEARQILYDLCQQTRGFANHFRVTSDKQRESGNGR